MPIKEQQQPSSKKEAWPTFKINPVLRAGFSACVFDERPACDDEWWFVPYVEYAEHAIDDIQHLFTTDIQAGRWIVRCLDGEGWDRPSELGSFDTLEQALLFCQYVFNAYADLRREYSAGTLFNKTGWFLQIPRARWIAAEREPLESAAMNTTRSSRRATL